MAKTRVVGVDIGTSAVRAAELEFGGGSAGRANPTLLRFAQVGLPPGAVQDAEVAQPETVATALRELWRTGKFSTRDVVVGVGSQRVVVREMDMPAAPMAQLRAALPYQVQELLPMPVDDALLDFYPTGAHDGPTGRSATGLLVAATKETVRMTIMAAETAALRPEMVDLNAFALIRALAREEAAGQVVGLVDIGARVTTVVVTAGGQPRLSRILASGGQDVTDAVAGHLQLSVAEAEMVKREIGVGFAVAPERQSGAAAIAEVTRGVVEAVRNTFVYYSGNNPGAAINQVFLTGGGAMLPGLGQYLATATRIPTSFGDPLRGVRVAPGARTSLPEAPSLIALPIGLAYGVAA